MKLQTTCSLLCTTLFMIAFANCNDQSTTSGEPAATIASSANGGFESQVKWGEHLVSICGCNDCHTPKKMTPMGPMNDSSLLLSGHPAAMPAPDVDRKAMEQKGIATTVTETAWTGPWGISYAGNLTPDSTGLGSWTEEQFITCIRQGKYKGLTGERTLLPPMPWPGYMQMTDDEMKAMFAYLKTIPPIHNIVPQAAPPVAAMH